MFETEETMGFRHMREIQELRTKQREELEELRRSSDPNWTPLLVTHTVQGRAESFLRAYLREGGRSFREILDSAKKVGIKIDPLRRAKAALRVESYKVSLLWYWRFPIEPIEPAPSDLSVQA